MDNFSNLMMIGECLLDHKRGMAFKKAIFSTVKEGDVVLDAGCGSGIMSLFSAKAKASKVFALEIDPEIVKITKANVKSAGYDTIIKVINADLKSVGDYVKTPVDVVVMEMMDTALVSEQQIPAINALYDAKIVNEKTKFIPCRMQNFLQFTSYNFNFFGFNMPFIVQARNFATMKRVKNYYSEKLMFSDVNLSIVNKTKFKTSFEFNATGTGVIDSAVLSSLTFLTSEISIGGTSDMNMPVILQFKPCQVTKGQTVKVSISYEYAEGFSNLKINLES